MFGQSSRSQQPLRHDDLFNATGSLGNEVQQRLVAVVREIRKLEDAAMG